MNSAINNHFPSPLEGEITPRSGTWQADAHAAGRRFFGDDKSRHDTPLDRIIEASAITDKKIRAIGNIAMPEVPDNIVRGYN